MKTQPIYPEMPPLPKQVTTEIWIQCQLRFLIDLEIAHDWPLDGFRGENVNFFRTRSSELLDTPLTGALEEVMFELCADKEFLDSYLEAFEELDNLDPGHAARVALSQELTQRETYIQREVESRSDRRYLRPRQ